MTKPKNMPNAEWRERQNARYAGQRHHICKLNRKYRLARPAAYLFAEAKKRAKKSGLDFDIELSDVQIPFFCPLLCVPLSPNVGGVKYTLNSPSLDRIDNDLGYVKGNVWVISDMANRMKRDATVHQLKTFAKQVLALFSD